MNCNVLLVAPSISTVVLLSRTFSQWYSSNFSLPNDFALHWNVTVSPTVELTNICGFSVMTGGGTIRET